MHRLHHLLLVLACGWSLTSCRQGTPPPAAEEPIQPPPPPVRVVEVRRAVEISQPRPTPERPIVGLPKPPRFDPAGYQLIMDHEVGGGRPYYDKRLSHPTVPPGESGVTIGVGYDLRFNSASVFRTDWRNLDDLDGDRLAKACGLTHVQSQAILPKLRDIIVQWRLAEGVFNEVTLTRFYQLAKRTFPGLTDLDPRAQAVLTSLTFNRGSSLGVEGRPSWDSRREMRELSHLSASKKYKAMAQQIRKMKRLWVGKGMDGLLRRREDEARLMEACGS